MNELTKSEKRKCRELIQLGLNRVSLTSMNYLNSFERRDLITLT